MALCTCGVAAALALREALRARRRLLAFAAALVLPLCAASIVMTLQRTIWIGSAAAVVMVVLLEPKVRWPVFTAGVVAGLLVVVTLIAVPGLHTKATDRTADQETVWDRKNLNNAALAMAEARPLTGFGWHRFSDRSASYFWQADTYPLTANTRVVHDAILANAAELGLPGTLLWVFGIAGMVLTALRAPMWRDAVPWRAGLLGISIVLLALALFTPMLEPWPLLALAILTGAVRAQGLPRSQT
jgi:O-antigen ligase